MPKARFTVTVHSHMHPPNPVTAEGEVQNMEELVEWAKRQLEQSIRVASMFSHWDYIESKLDPPW